MRLSSREIEQEVEKYCELRNIPQFRGKILRQYQGEVEKFIADLIKHQKKKDKKAQKYKIPELSQIIGKTFKERVRRSVKESQS